MLSENKIKLRKILYESGKQCLLGQTQVHVRRLAHACMLHVHIPLFSNLDCPPVQDSQEFLVDQQDRGWCCTMPLASATNRQISFYAGGRKFTLNVAIDLFKAALVPYGSRLKEYLHSFLLDFLHFALLVLGVSSTSCTRYVFVG